MKIWTQALLGLLVLPLAGCTSAAVAGPVSIEMSPRVDQSATATYAGPLSTPTEYPNIGISMKPPATSLQPKISWKDAVAACVTDKTAVCGDVASPSVSLAAVSSANNSTINPDGSKTPTISDELAYVITWPSVKCIAAGPAGAEQKQTTCIFVSLFDANSGAFIGAGQSNSPTG